MFSSARGPYPAVRMRRLRRHDWSRRLVAESSLSVNHLIWPLFAIDQPSGQQPIASLPGVHRLGLDDLKRAAAEAVRAGIPAIAIFPATDPKLRPMTRPRRSILTIGLSCRESVKREVGDQLGSFAMWRSILQQSWQDGLVKDGYVVNDETVELLCQQAIVQAQLAAM